jgi:hypothetical protein
VYETGNCKVPVAERSRNRAHVGADSSFSDGVVFFSLQHDAAAVSERLENVLRRVLIHSHRGFAPLLECGERGIGCSAVVASGASEERGERERRETEHLHAQ